MVDYLELARGGRNDWWRYLISLPGILFLWFFIGSIPVILMMFYVSADGDPATDVSGAGFTGIPVHLDFLVNMLSFVPFIVATMLAVRFVHARPVKTLVTGAPRVRWGRILAGAGVWFVIAALVAIVESTLYPGRYVLTFDAGAWASFAVMALIITPIQTSAEEFFFRGYLLQWTGLRLKNRWILAFINGVLFFLPHIINPEMASNGVLMGLSYFAFGFFAAFITMKDNGMELAIGLHAANNLFAGLFANYTVTALPSPAMFTIQTLDAAYGLISVAAGMLVFYLVFFGRRASGVVQESPVE